MYHNVVPDDAPSGYKRTSITLPFSGFKRQINWLYRYFRIVPLSQYLEEMNFKQFDKSRTIALTFDDGTAMTFDLVCPFFDEKKIPATIFVSTCQLEGGELIWGSSLNAICLEDTYTNLKYNGRSFNLQSTRDRRHCREELFTAARISGDPAELVRALVTQCPINDDIRPYYAGMTYKQLKFAGASDLIEIGSHTVSHPFLTDLKEREQYEELAQSKQVLEQYTSRKVRYFAYPNGDYDQITIEALKSLKYEAGLAVIPKGLTNNLDFEIARMGVFSTSLLKLGSKILLDKIRFIS